MLTCLKGFEKYKKNDRVAICGFAPTSRHFAPFNDPTWDLWGMNEAAQPNIPEEKRWWKGGETGWFQIHPKWDFMRRNNRNDLDHWDWLRERDGKVPIFMQHKFRDVPGSVRYPLEEVIDLVGQYLTSSFSYMMGLAVLMGYKQVALFGFEMSHDSEYLYQKAGAEYLIGFAKGMGIEVMIPPDCALLRDNLYAYEDLRAASRTYYGMLREQTSQELALNLEKQHRAAGQLELFNALLDDPELAPEIKMVIAPRVNQLMEHYRKECCEYAYSKGLIDRTTEMIKWHDSQNIPDDRPILDFRSEEEKNVKA